MLKKLLCTLLCAALLLSAGCAAKEAPPAQEKAPTETYIPQAPQSEEPEAGEPVYLDENSEEYRTLYTENPIEQGFDERFSSAVSTEDFEALSIDYRAAWEDEYHALMEQLIALYPDDAEELKGLRDYTDDAAQTAYTENYSQHIYLDEDGQEQVGVAAVQSGHFAAAEIYREATVLSILNDYREDAAYSFRYTIN